MGTHGLFGFFYQGRFYVVYNHFDSYEDGLGWESGDSLFDCGDSRSGRHWSMPRGRRSAAYRRDRPAALAYSAARAVAAVGSLVAVPQEGQKAAPSASDVPHLAQVISPFRVTSAAAALSLRR